MPNWTLKLDEAGSPVLQEGKPVYVDADLDEPVETAFDVNQLHGKILSLGRESKTHREKYKNTTTELGQLKELFGEVDDVAEWKTKAEEALKTVQNLKDQDFVKADRVEKLKREMSESFSEKEKRLQKALSDRESDRKSVV